jgi:membrane peptidoglycan carboxypeptidase
LPEPVQDSMTNDYTQNGISLQCSSPLSPPYSALTVTATGCPYAQLSLADEFSDLQLVTLFRKLGFYQSPTISLPVAQPLTVPTQITNHDLYRLGQAELSITPLQMALAAATINNNGFLPTPHLVLGIKLPDGTWSSPSNAPGSTDQVFTANQIRQVLQVLSQSDQHYWSVVGMAQNSSVNKVTWFIGGTTSDWQGQPLVAVVLMEEDNPNLAKQIGQALLTNATSQK